MNRIERMQWKLYKYGQDTLVCVLSQQKPAKTKSDRSLNNIFAAIGIAAHPLALPPSEQALLGPLVWQNQGAILRGVQQV